MIMKRELQIRMINDPIENPPAIRPTASDPIRPQHDNLLHTVLFHDGQGVAHGVGHQVRRRCGLRPGVVARSGRVEGGYDGFDGVGWRRVGEGGGYVGGG